MAKLKSLNTVEAAPQVEPQQFINNISENPRIFTSTSFAVIAILSGISSSPPLFLNKFKYLENMGQILISAIPIYWVLSIGFPMVVYIANKKVRTFVWNELVPTSVRNSVANIIAIFQILGHDPDKPPENDSGIELQA